MDLGGGERQRDGHRDRLTFGGCGRPRLYVTLRILSHDSLFRV